jgi:hypothetical protein
VNVEQDHVGLSLNDHSDGLGRSGGFADDVAGVRQFGADTGAEKLMVVNDDYAQTFGLCGRNLRVAIHRARPL